MRPIALVVLVSLFTSSAACAQLDQQQASAKNAAILKGDPYGDTAAAIATHFASSALVTAGTTACGKVKRPVWSFHVVVPSPEQPIDGELNIDASTGKLTCATLPFLD